MNILLSILAVILVNFPLAAYSVSIEGIVLTDQGPVLQAKVMAYADYESLTQNRPAFTSSTTEKPGQFIIDLPEGSYYFTAQGTMNGKDVFTYHGLNPITVNNNKNWIPFFAVPDHSPSCEDGFQGIGGQVIYKDTLLADGSVSAYSLSDEPFRGMGVLTNSIDSDGNFWFDLEPGSYVIVARQRRGEDAIGPLKKGDLFCYAQANPIEVKPARSCQITIPCYPRDQIETFLAEGTADPRGRKETLRRDASLQDVTIKEAEEIRDAAQMASTSGRINDLEGKPAVGLYISAYPADDLSLFQMYIVRFKTEFLAQTDKDGQYVLKLKPGSYYLVARQKVGEAPISGELYGLYEGSPNHSINIWPAETRTNVNILVSPVMP